MQSKTCKIKHLPHKSIFSVPAHLNFEQNSKNLPLKTPKLLIFSLYISDSPASVGVVFLKAPLLALSCSHSASSCNVKSWFPAEEERCPTQTFLRGRIFSPTVGSHESPKENSPKSEHSWDMLQLHYLRICLSCREAPVWGPILGRPAELLTRWGFVSPTSHSCWSHPVLLPSQTKS